MTAIPRSSNCAAYTDMVSLLVDGEATVDGAPECALSLPTTFSCQTSAFEKPDVATENLMVATGKELLAARGCDVDAARFSFNTVLLGAQSVEYSGEKLSSLGMASNCYKAGNDPNDATHKIVARCRNEYDMTDDQGQAVRNTKMVFHSSLLACDVSDTAMPQLMEDARKVAVQNSIGRGFTPARDEDLACDFAVLPTL